MLWVFHMRKIDYMRLTHSVKDALAHFLSSFIREGYGKYMCRCSAALNKMHDTLGKHARFASSCSSDDQYGTVFMRHGLALFRIEHIKNTHSGSIIA